MATTQLIKEALKTATPAQLVRVRAVMSRGLNDGSDYDPWFRKRRIQEALQAFDGGHYGAQIIAEVLSDEDLGEALR